MIREERELLLYMVLLLALGIGCFVLVGVLA